MTFRATLYALLLFVPIGAAAQSPGYLNQNNTTGTPDYSSFDVSNIDSVNLANGGVTINIPFVNRSIRSSPFVAGFRYDSKLWVLDRFPQELGYNPPILYQWRVDGNNSGWQKTDSFLSTFEYSRQEYECQQQIAYYDFDGNPVYGGGGRIITFSGFVLQDSGGTKHSFPNHRTFKYIWDPVYGICDEYGNITSQDVNVAHSDSGHTQLDVSGITAATWYTDAPRILKYQGGESWHFHSSLAPKDSNGNRVGKIGYDANAWVLDSYGRQAWRWRANAFDYLDTGGAIRTISFQYTNIPTTAPFPNPAGHTYQTSVNVLSNITFPDGRTYQFSYEDPNNPGQPNPYGELTKITLPTGGYIRYKYTTVQNRDSIDPIPHECNCDVALLDARVLIEKAVNDGTGEKIWQYAYGETSTNRTTTVTDPDGNVRIHTFSLGDVPLEVQVEFRQGSTTPIKRIAKEWTADPGPTISKGVSRASGYAFIAFKVGGRNSRVTRETTSLVDLSPEVSSKVETDYGDCFTYSSAPWNDPYELGNWQQTWIDCRENPTQIREYDFNQSTPTRTKVFTYLHNQDSEYLNAHIWNRLASTSTYQGTSNGPLAAQTQNVYDSTTILSTSGVPYHDYVNFSSSNSLRGNITKIRRWRNNPSQLVDVVTQTYDDLGNLRSSTDALGHTVQYSYTDAFSDGVNRNTQAFLTSITSPNPNVSHIEARRYYYYTGQLWQSQDPNARVSTFEYDLAGRIQNTFAPDGGQANFTYPTPNQVVSCTKRVANDPSAPCSPSWMQAGVLLDGLGRISQTQTVAPECVIKKDKTYDSSGRPKTESNPYCSSGDPTYGITSFDYDALDRLTKVTHPDGNYRETKYFGYETDVIDEARKWRRMHSDAFGRIWRVFEFPQLYGNSSGNLETQYRYDVLDNLVCVEQHGNAGGTGCNSSESADATSPWRVRRFTYDSLGRLTRAKNPESGVITYTYDNDGNLITKTDARNVATTFAYDPLHRLIGKTFNDGTPAATLQYDSDVYGYQNFIGRLSKSCWEGASVNCDWYGYDVMGRVRRHEQGGGMWPSAIYSYDLTGAVTRQLYYEYYSGYNRYIDYDLDSLGRVTAVHQTNGANPRTILKTYASGIAYQPHGAWSAASISNGAIQAARSFSPRLQPYKWNALKTSTQVKFFDVEWDFTDAQNKNNGNVMGYLDRVALKNVDYTYDNLNRIASAATQDNAWGNVYGIDAWGNMTVAPMAGKLAGENMPVAGDGNNRLGSMTYDASGNVINDGAHVYAYDPEGRIKSMDSGAALYTYSNEGRRAKKAVGGTTTHYLQDAGGKALSEFVNGIWSKDYIYLNGELLATESAAQGTRYHFADHLGTPRVIADAAGGVISRHDYYPFGKELTTSLDGETHKFTGKERDTESGLDYFGARYYGSPTGRFTSADPLLTSMRPSQPLTLNRYAYVLNNPLRFTDPSGLYEEDVHRQLTEVLAQAAGFNNKVAAEIAAADQATDERSDRTPMTTNENQRRAFHFTSETRRGQLWDTFNNSGSAEDLGTYLHAFQDSYSHSEQIAHGKSYHLLEAPDKTYNNPEKATTMARGTYDRLTTAAQRMGAKDGRVAWAKIDKMVQQFNTARTSADKERILRALRLLIQQEKDAQKQRDTKSNAQAQQSGTKTK